MRFLILFLVIPFAAFCQDVPAETEEHETSLHRTFLHEKVESIEKAVYKRDGREVEYELEEDGETVTLPQYEKQQRVIFSIVMPNGTRKEIEKSPCDIFEEVAL